MKKGLLSCIAAVTMMASNAAMADDLEGKVEAVDAGNQTFVVQGITFHVTKKTDYDDGLRQFGDLQVGQRVEVDFKYRDGKHYATEAELDRRD